MAFATPLFIPLSKGLDLSREATLGGDELRTALNVDFTVDGQVRGRPSRAASSNFLVKDPATASTAPSYIAATTFTGTGFTPRGLMRVRDINGERPALGCNGRLFTKEATDWADRGHFACAKVDRIHDYKTNIQNPVDERVTMTVDFGRSRNLGSSRPLWALLSPTGALDREQAGTATSYGYAGNGARCGTTTAVATRGGDGHIYFTYRVAGAGTLTTVDLTNTTAAAATTDSGDAISICCSHDATGFWVVCRDYTDSTKFNVFAVSITGIVTASYASAPITSLHGLWIDNTPVAGNRVVVGFTHTAGVTMRTLNATTMAFVGDSAYDLSGAGVDGTDVVVGCQDSTTCWFAYRSSRDIAIGVCGINSAASAVLVRQMRGGQSTGAASIQWAICHQPVLVAGRMYLTLAACPVGQTTATWIAVDLSNRIEATVGTGPFTDFTLVAQGPASGTYPHLQPSSAITLADGTGWAFATQDWTQFSTVGGLYYDTLVGAAAKAGVNYVRFSGARSASVGGSTVFSGSVPHHLAGGVCTELGFPFLNGIPGIQGAADTGGAIPAGAYGVQVCWRWTDRAGQIHRSAASQIVTVTTVGGALSILLLVSNPWLCEKSTEVYIEVYVTAVTPTVDADHFFQGAYLCNFGAAYTTITLDGSPALSTTSEAIYTDGSVLYNYPVSADGGLAAVGRRLWTAGATTVYASKYLSPGTGVEFNDEGTHQVEMPAGAGRILSLEPLDDKVVVFCERGIFFIQDGGPDRTGTGSDFQAPVRLSDLALAGPRASCSTDAGVLFCTTLDATDAARGGPWLIDRQLTFTERQYIGRAATDFFLNVGSWVPEVAYSPERQQAYLTTPSANGTSDGVVVLDMRVGKWAVWDTVSGTLGALRHITVVSGILWALNTEPGPYNGAPGTDATANGAYAMVIKTGALAADGRDAAGWSRIRSIRPVSGEGVTAHTLVTTAIMDATRTYTSGSVSVSTPSVDTTWPSSRDVSEWRLPSQKCSTLQVQLSASPATARWAAIRLDVAPLPKTAPPRSRS